MTLFKISSCTSVQEEFQQKIKTDARKALVLKYAPLIVLAGMTLFSALFVDKFFTIENIRNLMSHAALPLILATGLSFVLLIGGIDLSLEGVMGASGAVFALLVTNSVNSNNFGIPAVLIVLVCGALAGTINGLVHIKLRIPSFMTTFAIGNIVRGFGLLTYKTTPPIIKNEAVIKFSSGSFLGIPNVMIIALLVFFAGCIILNYTAFGRACYAVGDNEVSAKTAGININIVKFTAFIICGTAVSIAGIMGAVLFKVGQVGIGDNMLFPTIAAVTVGGLTPGVGGMLQTITGVMIYTELENYLTLMGVNVFYKQAIQGIIILIAVAFSATRNKKIIVK